MSPTEPGSRLSMNLGSQISLAMGKEMERRVTMTLKL